MEELKKLVRIVTQFSRNSIPLLDLNKNVPDNKEEKLLNNIKRNVYATDSDAVLDLYGSKSRSYRYRMLKSRLREKLHNHLFFIEDISRMPRKEEKKCVDLIYRGRVLINITEYAIARQLFNKALKIAKKYEFTDLHLDCLSGLNFIYSQLPDYKQFYKSLNELKKVKARKKDEDQAYEIYYSNKIELQRSIVSQKNILKELPASISELKQLWEKSSSYNIFYFYYMLNGWFLELKGDFNERIRIIESCEEMLRKGKINTFRFDHLLNKYVMIYALFRAKKLEKGLELAPKYLVDLNPFSRNWFAFMQHYFLLAMHAGNYNLAVDLIVEVDHNIYFKRIKKKDQESWALYKAYLFFLNPRGQILDKFNYQKFITSVPEHSKDKLGHNIALHILQFLYYLRNGDYDQLYYKEGALRKYISAYLKDRDSQRSRLFFKLLIITIRTDFNLEKINNKSQNWFAKLKSTPEPGDAYARAEIVPYETVWNLILDYLKDNASKQLS